MIVHVHGYGPPPLVIGLALGAAAGVVLLLVGIVWLLRSVYAWLAVLAIALLVLAGGAAFAQDFRGVQQWQDLNGQHGHGMHGEGHADGHDWYKSLKQPGSGYSCCDDQDCRPTRAYQDEAGLWHAMLDGRWIIVPPHAVLKELAPDGNSHICASPAGIIFCFIGGSPKS